MGVYAMTGGSNGMGAAARKMLENRGDIVINVDIKGTDIIADLGTKEGRKLNQNIHYTLINLSILS